MPKNSVYLVLDHLFFSNVILCNSMVIFNIKSTTHLNRRLAKRVFTDALGCQKEKDKY